MRKVVALSKPVLISSMNSTFFPPTMISPAPPRLLNFLALQLLLCPGAGGGDGGDGLELYWGMRTRANGGGASQRGARSGAAGVGKGGGGTCGRVEGKCSVID